ncbi:MAG: NAD(P)-dependent oxidoreductase [Oryzomonas sp.]|uniref:NAD-dependent epimerase/dehydratase family protein n=1 Tax=Oryzomonas sp. TaxID=2855186 RepID=UPI00284122B6|nr:NAD(P)-dependent oxidoreductase [Oryzomonas sp.]MDR3578466.1 NAD(P)-dependent oxidoreductase [Oryzomonas sp.]
MPPVRIAILGATSHIAKGLIAAWAGREERELVLYARSPDRVREFISLIGCKDPVILPVEDFGRIRCDVIVNCIGIADPGKLSNEMATIFTLTETWDRRVMDYVSTCPDALYINLSSGAIYGSEFSQPVNEASPAVFPVNAMTASEFYGIAKLHAEARHRAASGLNIVDLRIFSYFSRFIDPATRFLMTDIILALKSGNEMLTTTNNIVRDYVNPDDLVSLMDLLVARKSLNGVYDVYSRKPVTKFEILESFAADFGLHFRVIEDAKPVTATGTKDHYYSLNYRAAELGYQPRHSSLDSLRRETIFLQQGFQQ